MKSHAPPTGLSPKLGMRQRHPLFLDPRRFPHLRPASIGGSHPYGVAGRKANLAIMAEAGIEPRAKRQCEVCGVAIPTWRNGRRVPKSVRRRTSPGTA